MHALQRLVFANLEVRADADLYLRLDRGAWTDLNTGAVHFETGATLSSDTFFNGWTVGAWKRHCDIGTLVLRLAGAGEFVCTLGLHRLGHASVWLAQHPLSLQDGHSAHLPVACWDVLRDGLLNFHLRALGPGVLHGGSWCTPDPPLNPVRLGLVITHFNRQTQVLPAVARSRRELLEAPGLRDHLTLTVVDNSRNLPLAPHPAITHIANRNLGGSGGFARGLLRMAGALLREVAPWELLEKGAGFDGKVKALNSGLDMRRVDHLLEAERPMVRPTYGAWWFFAFALAEVRQYPFPFFVRGDDILFGLGNGFDITTLNGVACLGEDFSSKHGPMTAYLDARYHLVHALIAPRGSASRIFWVGSRRFLKALTGYLYSSAHAVTLAMRHTLQGPDFFRDNLDLQAVRQEMALWAPAEKLVPINRSAFVVKPARRREESRLRRWVRALSLQGFLLPGWLLRDRMTVQAKAFHGRASGVFRYRRVLYEHAQSGTGFVAEFDRGRFFRELGGFLGVWAALFRRSPELRRDYARGVREMTRVEFWRGVYPEARGTVAEAREEVVPAASAE